MDSGTDITTDQPSQQPTHSLQTWNEPTAIALVKKRLEPATREQLVRSLSCALILVAPAGFSEGDRKAWLAAAAVTLEGIPADLLDRGLTVARKTCDHPARIIPAIMAEIEEAWEARKRDYRENTPSRPMLAPPTEPEFERCSPEAAAEIMREFGLKANPLDRIV